MQAKVITTGEWVERKRVFPHGKLTQDVCTGNSVYHPGERRQAPKRLPQTVEHKLVRSVLKHGVDGAATRYENHLQGITGGKSNVGMRSSLACAGSSVKSAKFLVTNGDVDATIDAPRVVEAVPVGQYSQPYRSKGSRGLGRTLRAMRQGN